MDNFHLNKIEQNDGSAFEKMAQKANVIGVKNKTEPQKSIQYVQYVEAALFCLAYEMRL